MQKIYTSYYGNIKKIEEEYIKKNMESPIYISISRYLPEYLKEYVSNQNLQLSPSKELLDFYKKSELSNEDKKIQYIKKFDEELENINLKAELENIIKLSKNNNNKDIYLLCYENIQDFCHRHIIAEKFNNIIKKENININPIKEKFYENIDFSKTYQLPQIKEVNGDIFKIKSDIILNAVNTVGVMGKGLALEFKKKYPLNFEKYKEECDNNNLEIGNILAVKENNKWIINFPTKKHWKNKSQYKYIKEGMEALIKWIKENQKKEKLKTIAIPALGSGLGGLKWEKVKSIINNEIIKNIEELKNITFFIIPPLENQIPNLYLKKNKLFRDQKGFEFLSNMYYSKIEWKGHIFPSSENIYQYEKLPDNLKSQYIEEFCKISPHDSKRLGRKNPLRKDWEQKKIIIMFQILKEKFNQNPILKNKLLNIKGDIVEYNYWKDIFWGYDINLKQGKNYLGQTLMYLRDSYKNNLEPNYKELVKRLNKIKIAIIGSRTYNNYNEMKHLLNKFINNLINNNIIKNKNEIILISGGAKGADGLAKQFSIENNIEIIEILPDWEKYGKSAGFKRNYQIWNLSNIGIGFWDGKSKGTEHSIKISKEQNKDLIMYVYPKKKWILYNNNNFIIKLLKNNSNIEIHNSINIEDDYSQNI